MNTLSFSKTLLIASLSGLLSVSANAYEVQQGTSLSPLKVNIIAAQKADLVVQTVNSNYAKQDSVRVTIKNSGKLTSDSGILTGLNRSQRGSDAEGTIPAIKPGATYSLDLKFDSQLKKGDQLVIMADAKNHIDESNENNNLKTVNY